MKNTKIYFAPSFGNRPYALIGRDHEIKSFLDGLQSYPGSKDRTTLFLAQRGYGKTVLLLELAERAKEHDFIVASPTIVFHGMLDRIIEKIQEEGEEYIKDADYKLSGGSVGILGFTLGLQFERDDQEKKSFTYKLSKLCDALEKYDRGVLILIDEVQAANDDLKELIIAYQELVGMGKNIAIAIAGLPTAVSSMLNDHVLTFLNRANKVYLKPLSSSEIIAYYSQAFRESGIIICDELITEAANAADGSPYMMQLIGYFITKLAKDHCETDQEAIDKAIALAKDTFLNDICATTLRGLSEMDIRFLKAMTADERYSKTGDIANRMNVKPDYAQQYKRRLSDAGIIEQPRRGIVQFAVPYLKEYLLNNNDF